MDRLKFNPMSTDPVEQAQSRLKCLDALTCVNAFIHHYRESKDEQDFFERMSKVFDLCDNYGLVPKGNTFNSTI